MRTATPYRGVLLLTALLLVVADAGALGAVADDSRDVLMTRLQSQSRLLG